MSRLLLILCLAIAAATPAQSEDDLQALVDAGRLTVSSSLADEGLLVPGQRAQLVIRIATNTWFTGGTRIRIPEVTGLVMLQTEAFAANASETRDGNTWVIQSWTLDIYPQNQGSFTIPPVALQLAVAAGGTGNISGELLSPPVSFSVSVPPALEQADFWVASPSFSAEQSLDRDTAALQPGDAFERRITFEAADVQAMMLPNFAAAPLPGLAMYPAPPELINSNNRGQTKASRRETISYVAEQPGKYLLPARDFFWWNTRSETLEVLTLPAIEISVEGDTAAATKPERISIDRATVITGIAGILAALMTGWLLLQYRPGQTFYAALEKPLTELRQHLLSLRKPALPERLNPDSNAGE